MHPSAAEKMDIEGAEREITNNLNNSRSRLSENKKGKIIITLLLIACCVVAGLICAILHGKDQSEENQLMSLDYIREKNIEVLPLPNEKKIIVYDTTDMAIVDEDYDEMNGSYDGAARIQLNGIVYSRIIRYLEQQLSLNEDRCSPWVVDTFYPNDELAVTHCLHNGTFSFQIKSQPSNNFVEFHTDMKPYSVDFFLAQFRNAAKYFL